MTSLDKRVAEQLGAMALELLKLQSMIEDRDREIAELKARIPAPAPAANGSDHAQH